MDHGSTTNLIKRIPVIYNVFPILPRAGHKTKIRIVLANGKRKYVANSKEGNKFINKYKEELY